MRPTPPIPPQVLVVDDDPLIRSFISDVLIQDGFTVFSAGDGAEALRIARRRAGLLDLVLTDFEMGAISGLDVARVLRDHFPWIHIVMMSGTAAEPLVGAGFIDAFLEKPFTPMDLCRKLRGVLAGPPRTEHAPPRITHHHHRSH